VLYRGRPVAGAGAEAGAVRALRRETGLLLQDADAQILGDTVLDDAAFSLKARGCGREEAEALAMEALKTMSLEDRAADIPRALSGGQ
jgi:energy-coupling factor transporter ATP-binding protein EcfA2